MFFLMSSGNFEVRLSEEIQTISDGNSLIFNLFLSVYFVYTVVVLYCENVNQLSLFFTAYMLAGGVFGNEPYSPDKMGRQSDISLAATASHWVHIQCRDAQELFRQGLHWSHQQGNFKIKD